MGSTQVRLEGMKNVEAISASGSSIGRDVGPGNLPSFSGGSAMSLLCHKMQNPGTWIMTLSPFYSFISRSDNGFLKLSFSLSFFFASIYYFFLNLKFIYFERERESRGEAEREGERIPSSLLTVSVEPHVGLKPTNHKIMT